MAEYGFTATGLYETLHNRHRGDHRVGRRRCRSRRAAASRARGRGTAAGGDERLVAWRSTARQTVTSWREELMTPYAEYPSDPHGCKNLTHRQISEQGSLEVVTGNANSRPNTGGSTASCRGARTCRTGASTGRRSPPSPGPEAARASARSRRSTRTRRRWASRQRGAARRAGRRTSTSTRCGSARSRMPYLDKTNATTIHAALRLAPTSAAYDALGSVRVGGRRAARRAGERRRGAGRRQRSPLAGCPDPATRRAAATPRPRWSSAAMPTAPCSPSSSATASPPRSSSTVGARPATSDRSCGRSASARRATPRSAPMAWKAALGDGSARGGRCRPCRRRRHARSGQRQRRSQDARRRSADALVDSLAATVGNTGAARPALLLASALEQATPGQVDRARRARRRRRGASCSAPPPRSPTFAPRSHRRSSRSPAADRSRTASSSPGAGTCRSSRPAGRSRRVRRRRRRDVRSTGSSASSAPSTTTARCTCRRRSSTPSAVRWPRRDGTIATYTIDKLSYSLNPPVVFAVVDFDGGGRLPIELTDVDAAEVADRRQGGDDVPPAVHRRRRPQLLLEGAPDPRRASSIGASSIGGGRLTWHRTASRTGSRSSGWAAPASPSTGTRASTTC